MPHKKSVFHRKPVLMFVLLIVLASACTKTQAIVPTATPTVDIEATSAALNALKAQYTQSAEQTSQAMQTADAQATLDTEATLVAQKTANAAATSIQKAINSQATQTQTFFRKQTSTAESIMRETQQALPLFEWVQKLFDDGTTDTSDGKYYRMDDFDKSVAEINQAYYWTSDYEAENFLMSAHVALSSGSEKANWYNSSCGIIFGEENNRSYDYVDVSMDGNVYMYNCRGGSCILMAIKKYGAAMIPKGEVDIMLMVFKEHIHFYVNGEELISAADLRYVAGNIAYLLRSGTNKGFGTHCQMTNVGLWMYP